MYQKAKELGFIPYIGNGTANANQIHDPNLIYPSQVFALPKPKN